MTIDDQLREIARHADRHQRVITADEIVRRASGHDITSLAEHEDGAAPDLLYPGPRSPRPERPRWIIRAAIGAAAAVVLVAAVAVIARRDHRDATPITTDPPATTDAADDGASTLATAEDVEIVGFSEFYGETLNIDAVEEDGKVTGEFQVDDVVVTIQCADTRVDSTRRDLILGGEVTDDPGGQGLLVSPFDDRRVAEGDLVALIIREERADGDPNRDGVTLYDPEALPPGNGSNAGSCTELVESVPGGLDGGFFNPVAFGQDIVTGGGNCDPCEDPDSSPTTTEEAHDGASNLARAEDVGLVGDALATIGGVGGRTLNISAGREADGEVTGEFRVDDVVGRVECANTDLDDVVILVGELTADPTGMLATGQLLIMVIREGDPDSVALATSGAGSCTELLESVSAEAFTEGPLDYIDVEGNGNIETG